jgi:hypothetical protein
VTTPAVVITLPFEGRPQVRIEAEREGDELRLAEWIVAHPELLELYGRAIDAANETRRAA